MLGLTLIWYGWTPEYPLPSVAVTVNENVPNWFGVPSNWAVVALVFTSVRPGGTFPLAVNV